MRNPSLTEVLEAVVRQALELEDLTAHDVLEQIDALGRGDIVRRVRAQLLEESRSRRKR